MTAHSVFQKLSIDETKRVRNRNGINKLSEVAPPTPEHTKTHSSRTTRAIPRPDVMVPQHTAVAISPGLPQGGP